VSHLDAATELTSRYRDLVVAHQPVEATAMGVHDHDHELPDLSREALDAWTRGVSQLAREVDDARQALPPAPGTSSSSRCRSTRRCSRSRSAAASRPTR
jgi:hypothetical protein